MKKIAVVVFFLAVGAGFFLVRQKPSVVSEIPVSVAAEGQGSNAPSSIPEKSASIPSAPLVAAPSVSGQSSASAGVATTANSSSAPVSASTLPVMEMSSLPPLTVLDNARVVMKNYGTTFGENPVGTNQEITEALQGKNPKGINFISADSGLRVNENGEMVDAYGTPFFFHQISGKQMEIRSAGQDRKMWTFDDLVTR
jgi:hypothetical protein